MWNFKVDSSMSQWVQGGTMDYLDAPIADIGHQFKLPPYSSRRKFSSTPLMLLQKILNSNFRVPTSTLIGDRSLLHKLSTPRSQGYVVRVAVLQVSCLSSEDRLFIILCRVLSSCVYCMRLKEPHWCTVKLCCASVWCALSCPLILNFTFYFFFFIY